MGVIAELLVEMRTFPDRAVHKLGALGPVPRIQIGFHRGAQRGGSLRKLAQDGLTPDDDDLPVFRDRPRCTDQVLKLGTRHRCACAPPR